MKAAEARDVGRAAGTTLRQATRTVRGVHGMVSDAAYAAVTAALGPGVTQPIKTANDLVTAAAYGATGMGLDAASRIAGFAASLKLAHTGDRGPSVHDGRGAHRALAASVGLRGDAFAVSAPSLAPAMQVRAGQQRTELAREGLAHAYPDAGPDIAVYLHGLCQSESSWSLGAGDSPTHPERLAADLGLSPVLIRYNTGLRVSHNGAHLADLLDDLIEAWPVQVRRLVLVGFSMGGLVVHSAMVAPAHGERTWTNLVSDTVTIGTPHHGSPMARGAQLAVERLSRDANGRRAIDLVRQRSAGIKDLMATRPTRTGSAMTPMTAVTTGRTQRCRTASVITRSSVSSQDISTVQWRGELVTSWCRPARLPMRPSTRSPHASCGSAQRW